MSKNRNILSEWFSWHFAEMPGFLFEVWKNYLFFALNYFSFPILLKTFFSPWKKYNWSYPRGFDVAEILNTFISNIFSRFLGALIRTVLIIIGFFFQLFVLLIGAIAFFFWLAMPFIIILGFLFVLFF